VTDGAHTGAPGGTPAHRFSFRRELARKAIHLTSAAVPIALALGVPRRVALPVLGALALVALMVEGARTASPSVSARFASLFQPLLRPHESTGITGATWLLGAMFAAVLLLPRDAAIIATWAAAAGDTAAALIGMRFGRIRSSRDGKSLEGSAACLLVTTAGALLLTHGGVAIAILTGVTATAAERFPWPSDDNIRIITAVGVVAMIAMAL
jgi:dolichol kinase